MDVDLAKRKALAKVQRAFHDADNVLRALPYELQDDIVDAVLLWAVSQYLPVSSFFKGMFAYTIHPDERVDSTQPVLILHARKMDSNGVEIVA